MNSFLARTLVILLAFLLGAALVKVMTAETVEASFADSGKRYVAVTGPYQDGVSLLYVIDQETQHLAVYEARGGATNSHRLYFVGARNIELDTMIDGYHDESDLSHQDLEAAILKSGNVLPEDSTKTGG